MTSKRAITMDDIARLARVSKPTVSRALSDSPLVKPATKSHVLSIAREQGYAVNRNAQRLRHKRTNTIAVSLDFRSHQRNHIADPFIYELLAGVSEALGDLNQDLLLCAPGHNDAEAFRELLLSRAADGFIILGQGHREAMLQEFAESGAPLVVWGAVTDDAGYCIVGSDNFLGGQLAGRYLIEKGRRRVVFLGDTSFREIARRRDGLQSAVSECGRLIAFDEIPMDRFSYEAAFAAANRYLSSHQTPPDAVFASNDTAAIAFIRAFRDRGFAVPADASIVGYNDIPSAAYFSPALTTIRQDIHQAGQVLVSSLMQQLDGEPAVSAIIRTELIVRET